MDLKNSLLKVGLISLLAFGASVHAAQQTLRIGIEAAYPPFASKTTDNKIVGFDYDIGQALCAEMNVQCEWQEQEFDGLIPALKVKKVDAVISSVSITPERLKSVDFTDRYYRIPARLVFKKGSGISGHSGTAQRQAHRRATRDQLRSLRHREIRPGRCRSGALRLAE